MRKIGEKWDIIRVGKLVDFVVEIGMKTKRILGAFERKI